MSTRFTETRVRFPAAALRQRLGRRQNWIAFAAISLPCAGWYLWSAHSEGGLRSPIAWVPEIFDPTAHLFGIIWLSPIPVQWLKGRPGVLQALAAIGFAEGYLLTLVLLDGWLRSLSGPWPPMAGTLGLFGFFFAPIMAVAGFLLAARERLHEANQEIQAQAREAQAKALQGQLNPHVLFNALNGISELVHKQSPAAEESLRHLSGLLRKVLDSLDQPAYTLEDERDLLEDFLYMEGLRLGDRFGLTWTWDRSLDRLPIPPLLVQPLVENALKHGIAPSEEGGELVIAARAEGTHLVIEVRNTGQRLDPGHTPGVGLRNVRARLELLGSPNDSFALHQEAEWAVAVLRLEQRALCYGDESASSRSRR